MRTNFIPALLVTLALALPLWAGMRQYGGHPATGEIICDYRQRYGPSRPQAIPAPRQLQPRAQYMLSPRRAGTAPTRAARRLATSSRSAALRRQPQIYRGPGPHNGDWLRGTMRLPPQEQEQRLEQDQHFRQLPPQRQQELRNRLQRFTALPPQQQQRVLNRMEMLERLRPEQRQQARNLFGQFRAMDPQRKEMIRSTLRQMRIMPPDARERMLNSPDTRSRYSPQEIQMLHGFNDIGFAGGAEH